MSEAFHIGQYFSTLSAATRASVRVWIMSEASHIGQYCEIISACNPNISQGWDIFRSLPQRSVLCNHFCCNPSISQGYRIESEANHIGLVEWMTTEASRAAVRAGQMSEACQILNDSFVWCHHHSVTRIFTSFAGFWYPAKKTFVFH